MCVCVCVCVCVCGGVARRSGLEAGRSLTNLAQQIKTDVWLLSFALVSEITSFFLGDERNSQPLCLRIDRWSTKKRVPGLGNENSTFDEVNDFYAFW